MSKKMSRKINVTFLVTENIRDEDTLISTEETKDVVYDLFDNINIEGSIEILSIEVTEYE